MTTSIRPPDTPTDFETVIGLEVHVQLKTESKMFCRCSAEYAGAEPNTHVCPVCFGMPGVLPVINTRAVEWTIKTALALNLEIPERSKFDRKNYPYPDLMKGYQISQYDLPLSRNGYLDVEVDGATKRVAITRIHLEEDTARLVHRVDEAGETYSLLDVNRSGVALMEVVSEPDMRSAEEARGLSGRAPPDPPLPGGEPGADGGGILPLRRQHLPPPAGSPALGTKVEIKNMNSFRGVYKALLYEVARQTALLHQGAPIHQETRGWMEDREVTIAQRSKESAHDYRYFPEPDLPPLVIDREQVERIRATLPELPAAKRTRFRSQYGLGDFEANLLTDERPRADYFEAAAQALGDNPPPAAVKAVANWMVGEMARLHNEAGEGAGDLKVAPAHLAQLVTLIERGTISNKLAKGVFETMYATGRGPEAIVAESGQTQISDVDALRGIIEQVLGEQPDAVSDYRGGKVEAAEVPGGPGDESDPRSRQPGRGHPSLAGVAGAAGVTRGTQR